jgi:hypothetical protein
MFVNRFYVLQFYFSKVLFHVRTALAGVWYAPELNSTVRDMYSTHHKYCVTHSKLTFYTLLPCR